MELLDKEGKEHAGRDHLHAPAPSGEVRLLPVTRKGAFAARAHSRNLLSLVRASAWAGSVKEDTCTFMYIEDEYGSLKRLKV